MRVLRLISDGAQRFAGEFAARFLLRPRDEERLIFAQTFRLADFFCTKARALGSDISRAYSTVGIYTLFLWTLYPISWGLSEGGNIISPDSEGVFYGVLDVLAKVGFGALLLWGHRDIDPARLGLKFRSYDEEITGGHHSKLLGGHSEKDGHGNGITGTGVSTDNGVHHNGTSAPVATA